jgi:hypothetical protein
MESKLKQEKKPEEKPEKSEETREPHHSLDMHDGVGEDDGY